jgi:hypothetical protein
MAPLRQKEKPPVPTVCLPFFVSAAPSLLAPFQVGGGHLREKKNTATPFFFFFLKKKRVKRTNLGHGLFDCGNQTTSNVSSTSGPLILYRFVVDGDLGPT